MTPAGMRIPRGLTIELQASHEAQRFTGAWRCWALRDVQQSDRDCRSAGKRWDCATDPSGFSSPRAKGLEDPGSLEPEPGTRAANHTGPSLDPCRLCPLADFGHQRHSSPLVAKRHHEVGSRPPRKQFPAGTARACSINASIRRSSKPAKAGSVERQQITALPSRSGL
jgi:hypothetical protein